MYKNNLSHKLKYRHQNITVWKELKGRELPPGVTFSKSPLGIMYVISHSCNANNIFDMLKYFHKGIIIDGVPDLGEDNAIISWFRRFDIITKDPV